MRPMVCAAPDVWMVPNTKWPNLVATPLQRSGAPR